MTPRTTKNNTTASNSPVNHWENTTKSLPNHAQQMPLTLPQDGMSRLSQLLPFIPLGKSTVWSWVRQGKFPQPIKLSDNVTVWRNNDIHDWLNNPNHYQGGNHEPL